MFQGKNGRGGGGGGKVLEYLEVNMTANSYMIAITKLCIAEKFPLPLLGIDPGSPWYKTNALTAEPQSRHFDTVVRDYILEALGNLPYLDI